MGKELSVLGSFRPFGSEAEAALGLDGTTNDSYFLFDPELVRPKTGTAVISSCCTESEEEIYIRQNVLVWSAGRHVRKRYSAASAIIQAVWCSMEAVAEPLLCLLHSNSLTVYTPAGEINSVALPFAVSAMWALPCGLILQRAVGSTSYMSFSPSPSFRSDEHSRVAARQIYSGRRSSSSSVAVSYDSVYLTLQHPLEETEILQVAEGDSLMPLADSSEQIIWTSISVPYVASYHAGNLQHSVWKVEASHMYVHSDRFNKGKKWLKLIWRDAVSQPQAKQIFMANDEDGEPLLCFVIKESQKLFSLKLSCAFEQENNQSTDVDIAWTVSAVSAAPVAANGMRSKKTGSKHLDLLVLAPDGVLFFYTGRYPLCTFYLPLATGCSSRRDEIVELLDPVSCRVTVLTASGQTYRCAVLVTQSSGITQACLSALADGFRPAFYRYLLSCVLESTAFISQDCSSGSDTEWSIFSEVLLGWVSNSYRNSSELNRESHGSAWNFLLNSSMHKEVLTSLKFPALHLHRDATDGLLTRIFGNANNAGHESMLAEILEILHVLYEDYKLDTMRWRDLGKLGVLLTNIASALQEYDYADHYIRDSAVSVVVDERPRRSVATCCCVPANHFTWIENKLTGKTPQNSLPNLLTTNGNTSVDWSRKVLGFFDLLVGSTLVNGRLLSGVHIKVAAGTAQTAEQRTVLAMVAEGFGISDIDRLPSGISLPLRHALHRCRESPPSDWPSEAYTLVGREDLAYTSAGRISAAATSTNDVMMAAPYMLHLRPTLSSPLQDASEIQSTGSVDGQISDGMEHMLSAISIPRFGCDLRLNEVRRLLCSSKPVAVRTSNAPDISDPDVVAQQQAQLWQIAQRTTALPFGRGAFTLATLKPLLTEALPIPKLVLAGQLPSQHYATVNLDANVAELTSWPEFHNGVAAGLRLAPGQAKITRTWIVYNKPDEPSYEHAGLLMSLGFHKHLAVLAATDVFRYLAQEHDPTTVGILLGMAAAHRGTMDPSISKMLYLHIPARHPPSFPELELSFLLQSAALMAVGLLYQGSAHRLTTEILLAEVGRKPGSDSSVDRESYALAAGLALGLVTLGRGKDAWGLADLHIEDRLRHYMCGGNEAGNESRRRFEGISKQYEDTSQTGGQVMEGSIVNLDVTAPGATLALALMFMKTNDEVMAARLAIPDTHFALEYVRPDFILLRLVARSLILWDSVQASEEWVQAQIPSIVRESFECIEQGKVPTEGPLADVDMEALAQAHVNILAGACLSIGLRYAGTANTEAQQLLYHYALYFLKRKSVAGGQNSFVDRGTLETCLDVAVLSLSVVMAGTGHLETFKLLRYLRRRKDPDGAIVYGNHMAMSMAIGFLFLGGGTLTFSTNDTAVAALLISLYPRFPSTPNDHRCHLQAFRHLYVLATEARCVQTVDVDSGLVVYAPLEMTLKETHSHSQTSFSRVSPTILPQRSSLKRVRVCGPRYWPQDIQLSCEDSGVWWEAGEGGDPFNGGLLYVKRKVGARSYADDPIGCRSLLSRPLHTTSKGVDELVSTFSSDPSLLAFAQIFCSGSGESEFKDFCVSALFECVSMDRPALLQAYLALYTCVETFVSIATGRGNSCNSSSLCNVSITLQSLKVSLAASMNGEAIVQRSLLSALGKRMESVLTWMMEGDDDDEDEDDGHEHGDDVIEYLLKKEKEMSMEMKKKFMYGCYLSWYAFPKPSTLTAALHQLIQLFPSSATSPSLLPSPSPSPSPSSSLSSPPSANALVPILASILPSTPPLHTLKHMSSYFINKTY